MSSPPDRIFVNEPIELLEDPLGFFPSENQKTVPVPPPPPVHVPDEPRRDDARIAQLVRYAAVIVAALRRVVRLAVVAGATAVSFVRGFPRPRWRFPSWRLPTWRLPALRVSTLQLPKRPLPMLRLRLPTRHLSAWRLPAWQLPTWQLPTWQLPAWRNGTWRARIASVISRARPVVRRIATDTRLSAVTATAFACGVVVGGSAMWLSGASRQAGVESTPSQHAPRKVERVAESPIAPVATAFANTPVVPIAASQTAAAPAATANIRRSQFQGSLVVNSRPSGARVFVNGRSVGQTPLVLRNQPAGSRAIRVALDGYEPWSTAVQVVADTETQLRAELREQRPAAQP